MGAARRRAAVLILQFEPAVPLARLAYCFGVQCRLVRERLSGGEASSALLGVGSVRGCSVVGAMLVQIDDCVTVSRRAAAPRLAPGCRAWRAHAACGG